MGESYDGEAARLREELRALGRSLNGPDPGAGSETMVERVLERILAEHLPVPVAEPPGGVERLRERLRPARRWARLRWRRLVAAVCGLLTVLALTPPVRAAVVDWFGFGGVEVRHDPSAAPPPNAEVPGCGRPVVSLGEARRRAAFVPLVPGELDTPDAVTVSGLPHGRLLVSLCWSERGRTIRLDEFPARLDFTFAKTVRERWEWLSLDGGKPALWFARPHRLDFWLVDPDGRRFTRQERTAGPALLWTDGVTLRLEGVASKARALEIAESLKPADSAEPSERAESSR